MTATTRTSSTPASTSEAAAGAGAQRCDTERPELRELAPGHRVACHFAEEIRDGKIAAHAVEAKLVHSRDGAETGPGVTNITAEISGTLPPGH